MDILGYVKCTAPNCNAPMAVSRCNGKRAAFLKGRCNVCHCTEQRANANTQDYLKQYMPLEELNKPLEVQPEPISTPPKAQEVQPEPISTPPKAQEVQPEAKQVQSEEPKQDTSDPKKTSGSVSGWLCAGIGAGLGLAFGKAFTVLKAI
ncbi:hypothetical protein [Vibrio europaeus]|uniref:hypothetical protein n=1 Tax=Vibrio europaeus TaxID=300876 RepID=UPI00233F4B30|nr:hypothetical protein [Vibrio europaeus]MDC5719424.1 hypothetical protein [Vibrio europaeus]MDC5720980.1 hypothetical protein [Vibrio europaeus]